MDGGDLTKDNNPDEDEAEQMLRNGFELVNELILSDVSITSGSSSSTIENESAESINDFMFLNNDFRKIYIMYTNARSLSPKIVSLLDYFNEFNLSLIHI